MRYSAITAMFLSLCACSHPSTQKVEHPFNTTLQSPSATYSKGDWVITVPATFVPLEYTDESFTACDSNGSNICVRFVAIDTQYNQETFAATIMADAVQNKNTTDFHDATISSHSALYVEAEDGSSHMYFWNALDRNGRMHRFACAGSRDVYETVSERCHKIASDVRF